MAARSQGKVLDMVYYYNSTPTKADDVTTIPGEQHVCHQWHQNRMVDKTYEEQPNGYQEGDLVYCKPRKSDCVTPWPRGEVTRNGNGLQVEVDGYPRHVSDVRPVEDVTLSADETDSDGTLPSDNATTPRRNPPRSRRLPKKYQDFELEFRRDCDNL